jgi:phosphotransferase system HPr (HPr) family protein
MMFVAPSSPSPQQAVPALQAGANVGARDERSIVVLSEGLHARPASALAQLAMRFDARVTVILKTCRANAASILELLALGAGSGDSVELEASGAQSHEALLAVQDLITRRFEGALAAAPA